MAAHILTALREIKFEIAHDRVNKGMSLFQWKSLQDALNLACWTEDISLEEYEELETIVTERSIESITHWLDRILPKYRKQWENLGEPTTREEWNKIVYDEAESWHRQEIEQWDRDLD